ERGGARERLAAASGAFPGVLAGALASRRAPARAGETRFAGGLVGWLGAGCAAMTERVPVRREAGLPDAVLERFDDLIIFDHVRNTVEAVVNPQPADRTGTAAAARLERLAALVAGARAEPLALPDAVAPPADERGRARFTAAVRRAQAAIRAGEIFQVVLSVQERTPFTGDPFAVYRRLRMGNPSPYHFWLDQGDTVVLGASPELLVRVDGRTVELRPIAGTRPRGADDAADEALRRELLADAKEAAEHVMLVDLGRNDVGRVAEYGSVEVAALRQVELYSHVMHLVSSVKGRLRAELGPVDALFAGFPAGTVSGAPKLRALELIHELEEAPRGVYGGAVGYFDDSGRIDTCLAVRTITVRGGEAIVQGGAGIVADSDPAREFAECGHKTAALRAALGPAGSGVATAPPRAEVAR
ncbi:MAG: anthranilate synthase component I family protein, partial [Candidatus Krumholzibacteriia bacterium]